jgi:hypothetical protein
MTTSGQNQAALGLIGKPALYVAYIGPFQSAAGWLIAGSLCE